jgi:hypothetical protein
VLAGAFNDFALTSNFSPRLIASAARNTSGFIVSILDRKSSRYSGQQRIFALKVVYFFTDCAAAFKQGAAITMGIARQCFSTSGDDRLNGF